MSARPEWPWRPVKGLVLGVDPARSPLREEDGLLAVSALRSMSNEDALVLDADEAQIARTLADAVLRRLAAATYRSVGEDPQGDGNAGADEHDARPVRFPDGDERRLATSQQVLQRLMDLVELSASQLEGLAVDRENSAHEAPSSGPSGAGSVGAAQGRRPENEQTGGPA